MRRPRVELLRFISLGSILLIALGLRAYRLGQLSFWYDEVVTMTLAREQGLRALLSKLDVIDATRAPLHPILLHYWIQGFGPSEASGRAFSAICGVVTVALVSRIARRAFNSPATGLLAAWLTALSPMLIVYSREARMYSWLVMLTCTAWEALLSLGENPLTLNIAVNPEKCRRIPTRYVRLTWYFVCVVALGYSHPLGIFMVATLALGSLLNARSAGFSAASWLITHLLAATFISAWIGHYIDHPPELILGRLPIRFLFGTPIGWTGGNFLTLLPCLMVLCVGLFTWKRDPKNARYLRFTLVFERPLIDTLLLIWLTVPVAVLWVYSRVSYPLFGPARYTLYCSPPYLILLARGMARLPRWAAGVLCLGATAIAVSAYPTMIYAPDLKADWRGAAASLGRSDPSRSEPVLVTTNDPRQNLEIVTARYYLGTVRKSIALPAPLSEVDSLRGTVPAPSRFWLAIGSHDGWLTAEIPWQIPLRRSAEILDVNGLRLIAIDPKDLPKLRLKSQGTAAPTPSAAPTPTPTGSPTNSGSG